MNEDNTSRFDAVTLDDVYREEVKQKIAAEKVAKKNTFKPMLSATCEDITTLKYPVLVSPKLDGIRCVIRNGAAYSRNLKLIPNDYIQSKLKGLPDGLDGELIVGSPTGDDVWNRSQSGVMSSDGEPEFTYWVFDASDMVGPFSARYSRLHEWFKGEEANKNVSVVPHHQAHIPEFLAKLEDKWVSDGYEGVMVRDPNGKYKFGRSTVKEGGLLKIKRWHDAEAIVVDMVERQHNGNEATKDELGRTKRSSTKANKTGRGDMGTLVCQGVFDGKFDGPVKFEIGTGFTDEQRKAMWEKPVIGSVVTFKYQSLSPGGTPRFPVFKGFRDRRDMS